MLMDELHRHRTLADGGGATLSRARSHIARREDAGNARLEQAVRSRRLSGQYEAVRVACNRVADPTGARIGAEETEEERELEAGTVCERQGLDTSVAAVDLGDLAAVAHGDAVSLELADEVVGHGLAEIGPPVQERDERPTAGKPDRGLAGRVSSSDHRDPRRAAELGLGRSRRVEDARALVLREVGEWEAPVLGTGCEHDGSRDDLMSLLELDDVAAVPGLERDGAVRGGRPCAELARL